MDLEELRGYNQQVNACRVGCCHNVPAAGTLLSARRAASNHQRPASCVPAFLASWLVFPPPNNTMTGPLVARNAVLFNPLLTKAGA